MEKRLRNKILRTVLVFLTAGVIMAGIFYGNSTAHEEPSKPNKNDIQQTLSV